MSNSQKENLENYLSEKAKQAQESEQQPKPKSAYETCILAESAKIHELIAESQREAKERSLEDE
ncbi:hypothetical protein [Psychrobacter sp. LV10R520-6]|uniref:hypothetical protein n=1 Tax=Psychrobacter sp. LV10R520-6 TaxID=1415574 RepID=UPI0024C89749|nr:hypothetical protein [Psychrobacter sp. LV10R520-6]SNT71329.1 hypothetical protein SAMN04488491_2565 [Psychrobacter sp. LV10R520-6]